MPGTLTQILRDQKARIAEQLTDTAAPDTQQSAEERRATALARVDSLLGMSQQQPEILDQTLLELTRGQVGEEGDLKPLLDTIQQEHDAAVSAVLNAYPESQEALAPLVDLDQLTMRRTRAIVGGLYEQMAVQLQQTTTERQALRAAVQELSTPIIPLYSGILVLPLVGQIDDARAQDVTEQLLEAIAREQADIVLIDVTGILTLDTSVANHLMQTARAAALLGSQVILVGISAEIAQTLVHLNVDLGSLVTMSNLQSGVEYALNLLGLAIQSKA